MNGSRKTAVIVHGGAGRIPDSEAGEYRDATLAAVRVAMDALRNGAGALDAAMAAVQSMEDAPMLNAGYGSVLNESGELSFDASVMEGRALRAGAIAAIPGIVRSPVTLARLVMEQHPSVLLTCDGAIRFAKAMGIPFVDSESMITDRQRERYAMWKTKAMRAGDATDDSGLAARIMQIMPGEPEAEDMKDIDWYGALVGVPGNGDPTCAPCPKCAVKGAYIASGDGPSDTVGAVVRDASGWIVSALSTGGVRGKPRGRVGDTPLIGCGLYAMDELGGAAATGIGEDIIRVMLAGRAVTDIGTYGSAQEAAESAVRFMLERINGMAGVVMLDAKGNIGYAHTTNRMAVAYWNDSMNEPVTDLDGNLIE